MTREFKILQCDDTTYFSFRFPFFFRLIKIEAIVLFFLDRKDLYTFLGTHRIVMSKLFKR